MEQFPSQQNEMSDAELEREVVIEHNLTAMNEDMPKLLGAESIGGNGGIEEIGGKRYSCSAANGYAKPENGEIIMFKNIQNVKDKSTIEDNVKFILRIAMDRPERMKTDTFRGFFKIVSMRIKDSKKIFSDEGMANMKASIQRWNEAHENYSKKEK